MILHYFFIRCSEAQTKVYHNFAPVYGRLENGPSDPYSILQLSIHSYEVNLLFKKSEDLGVSEKLDKLLKQVYIQLNNFLNIEKKFKNVNRVKPEHLKLAETVLFLFGTRLNLSFFMDNFIRIKGEEKTTTDEVAERISKLLYRLFKEIHPKTIDFFTGDLLERESKLTNGQQTITTEYLNFVTSPENVFLPPDREIPLASQVYGNVLDGIRSDGYPEFPCDVRDSFSPGKEKVEKRKSILANLQKSSDLHFMALQIAPLFKEFYFKSDLEFFVKSYYDNTRKVISLFRVLKHLAENQKQTESNFIESYLLYSKTDIFFPSFGDTVLDRIQSHMKSFFLNYSYNEKTIVDWEDDCFFQVLYHNFAPVYGRLEKGPSDPYSILQLSIHSYEVNLLFKENTDLGVSEKLDKLLKQVYIQLNKFLKFEKKFEHKIDEVKPEHLKLAETVLFLFGTRLNLSFFIKHYMQFKGEKKTTTHEVAERISKLLYRLFKDIHPKTIDFFTGDLLERESKLTNGQQKITTEYLNFVTSPENVFLPPDREIPLASQVYGNVLDGIRSDGYPEFPCDVRDSFYFNHGKGKKRKELVNSILANLQKSSDLHFMALQITPLFKEFYFKSDLEFFDKFYYGSRRMLQPLFTALKSIKNRKKQTESNFIESYLLYSKTDIFFPSFGDTVLDRIQSHLQSFFLNYSYNERYVQYWERECNAFLNTPNIVITYESGIKKNKTSNVGFKNLRLLTDSKVDLGLVNVDVVEEREESPPAKKKKKKGCDGDCKCTII